MGWIPPPPALSQKEFDRRWKAGARTLCELDPEFAAWMKERNRDAIFAQITIAIAVVGIVGMLVCRAYWQLTG